MKYIAFEGIDFAGKSTQTALLGKWLTQRYYTPIHLFEPTYGRYGKEIRGYIDNNRAFPIEGQIDLFTKDREEHVRCKIQPLLEFIESNTSFLVIQDRCYLSAPAYQADSETSMICLLEKQRTIAPIPDIIFLVDVPVPVALKRQLISDAEASLFERRDVLERVRQNYLRLARKCRERIEVVDGRGPPEAVNGKIADILARELV